MCQYVAQVRVLLRFEGVIQMPPCLICREIGSFRSRAAWQLHLSDRETLLYSYCSTRQAVSTVIVANGKKIDVNKQGMNSVENKTVKLNLMGKSDTMEKKDWVDPSGRKGKVRFLFFLANFWFFTDSIFLFEESLTLLDRVLYTQTHTILTV